MASVLNRLSQLLQGCPPSMRVTNVIKMRTPTSATSITARYKSGGRRGRGWSRKGRGGRRKRIAQVIEVEVENPEDAEKVMAKKLEEVIQDTVVRWAAPDWLPFLPGGSYWVPPPPPKLGESIQIALANSVSEAELLSFSTARRGWPSSSYFLKELPSNTGEIIPEKSENSEEEES
eukprot:TRINITY_DN4776_c0_g1_i1.p1 TRINITY_DN4776_c0_g1~~TRINITY_DN4776_c0_g1_i1.p1  ORF type:complete len:204 (-),score=35.23 TRINITY_DN4776_c0_g1_i1:241-768(-)